MIFLNITIPPAIRPFLLIAPIVIAGFAIQNFYVYFTNTKPIEVSIQQLIANPPSAKWVRVTGGQINLIDAAAFETGFKKKIDSVYVPIHPEGKADAEVSVLLRSTDPELLALTRQFQVLDEAKDSEIKGLKLAIENARVILQKRPFEGLIQSGLFRDDRVIFQVRSTLPNIAREPIIIEEGKKPTIFEGLGILFFALVATVGVLSTSFSKGATPPPLPPSPPPLTRNV
ncbi:MAG: hypothetical protein ABL974_16350 [Prosthecobacter sp.]